MHSCPVLGEQTPDDRVEGELVATGMHADFEIRWEPEVTHGAGYDGQVRLEIALEGAEVARVIHPFVEASGELWCDGLHRDAFVRDHGKDHQQLAGSLGCVGFVHRNLDGEIAVRLAFSNVTIDAPGLLYRTEEFCRGPGDVIYADFDGIIEEREAMGSSQMLMLGDESAHRFVRRRESSIVGHIKSEEVAGLEEAVHRG